MHSNPSLTNRLSQAELDLSALHEEARRLGITLREIKELIKREETEKAESTVSKPQITEHPSPLPLIKETEPAKVKPKPQTPAVPPAVVKPSPTPPQIPAYSVNFEMELGRVWFVRLGIVLLTTGLVFLSSYTYKNWIHDLGPGIRLGLLYFVSFVITGAGIFCEGWKDSLKTYGRIVAAGGLAAIYYTSYAAHNVIPLKVIESPVAGSILLLLTAGLCGGVSQWRNSRLMLGASVALAFYSLILNPVGWMVGFFALVSSMGSCAIGRLKKWHELFFITLIGSYACYSWWEFSTATLVPSSSLFLVVFWLLFTAISLMEKFKGHVIFCGLNHVAFAFLYSFNLRSHEWINGHWLFCLLFGFFLLTIGVLAQKKIPSDSMLLHLTKGLSFVTLGIILKLSGHTLFLTLLFEAVILSAMQLRLKHVFVKVGSLVVAGIAFLAGVQYGAEAPRAAWFFAGLLWGAFGLFQRHSDEPKTETAYHPLGILGYGGLFLSLIFGAAKGQHPENIALILGGVGLGATVLMKRSVQLRYFVDLYLVAQITMLVALSALLHFTQKPLFFLIGFIFTITTSFIHRDSWNRTKDEKEGVNQKNFAILHYGLALLLLIAAAHFAIPHPPTRMVLTVALPLAGVVLATKTRWLAHAALPFAAYALLPEVFVFESLALFLSLLTLIAQLTVLRKWTSFKAGNILEPMTLILAAASCFFWIASLIEPNHGFVALLTWAGVGLLLLDRLYNRTLVTICAVPFLLCGVVGSWVLQLFVRSHEAIPYLALFPMITLHLWSSFARRIPQHRILGIISLLALWLTITMELNDSSYSASWAVLGTLSLLTGLILKSRQFRIVALIILGFSLGHVMLVDLVKLDPLPRILSFITLGLGLLGLGFVYNRWQVKLKNIL